MELYKETNDAAGSEKMQALIESLLRETETCRPYRLLICSDRRSWQKSYSTAQVAIGLAKRGKRTLLVDVDIFHPQLHRVLEVANHDGLTSCILRSVPLEKAGYTNLIENLTILTAGALEVGFQKVDNEAVKGFLEQLAPDYDYVILDGAPAEEPYYLEFYEGLSDGVGLVFRIGKTAVAQAVKANELLTSYGMNILGVILVEKYSYPPVRF